MKTDWSQVLREGVAQGPYTDTWESLIQHQTPQWYKDAKFGIFIHWGVYSVPGHNNEWYPRFMYQKGNDSYAFHVANFGDPKEFGYKDFIPLFRAEHFQPQQWIDLFKASGAKFIMPVSEHHDGFQMYESDISRWNAKEMGPGRDVLGELKACADHSSLIFTISNHRAEHNWFFNGALNFDSDVNDCANQEFYGVQNPLVITENTHDIYSPGPPKDHCEDWLARLCEIVEKYRPSIVWFDWWIHNVVFKPYLKQFAAYYYNKAHEWGKEVAINYKYNAFAYGSAVLDVERGQLSGIRSDFWQTDTSISYHSWGYATQRLFKTPRRIICDLIDIVSKNGCLLLNVGPGPDGTISQEETDVLLSIGKWLRINGEGIYETKCWEIFGEGPTQPTNGAFSDTEDPIYTSQDFRFTYKNACIYVFCMKVPEDLLLNINALKTNTQIGSGDFVIDSIELLGSQGLLEFSRDAAGCQVKMPYASEDPVCLKVSIN